MFGHTSAKRRAFTLIELLVVIAIIAILAAILFPVFAQAREKARSASCLSNQKQVGLAFMQYVQDFDETMPPVFANIIYPNSSMFTRDEFHWQDMIYPYAKSEGIFNCPSDPQDGPNTQDTHPYSYPPNSALRRSGKDHYGSYLYNFTYVYNGSSCNNPAGRAIADIGTPADTIINVESRRSNGSSVIYYGGTWENPQPAIFNNAKPPYLAFLNYYYVTAYHQQMTNVIWGDGHVKATRLEALTRRSNKGTGCLAPFTIQED
jgi:prepilin-type N-terminal cleavage/methylation domain-containing protein/prepilin-type processing-associated H-X9-DG protein